MGLKIFLEKRPRLKKKAARKCVQDNTWKCRGRALAGGPPISSLAFSFQPELQREAQPTEKYTGKNINTLAQVGNLQKDAFTAG